MPRNLESIRDSSGDFPPFAWPGGYPILYALADGAGLCAACANGGNGSEADTAASTDDQWRIVGYDVLEGSSEDYGGEIRCDHCNTILIFEES